MAQRRAAAALCAGLCVLAAAPPAVKADDLAFSPGSTYYGYRDQRSRYLILEDGPGPGRHLDVYDLKTRERILRGHFYDGTGQRISDEDISFWMTDGTPVAGACATGGGTAKADTYAVVERHVVFEFATRRLNKSDRTRCFEIPSNR